MPTTTAAHNLQIIKFVRRPDGLVEIYATILRPGVYYNIPFSSRAYPPHDTAGFPMTPAVADPAHTRDPVIAAGAGMPIVFVWNAPADGYAAVNLNGWRLTLAYLDLYCCEEDMVSPPEEDDPPTGSPGVPAIPGQPVPPAAPPPTTLDPVPPTTAPPWPGQPVPVPNTGGLPFTPPVPWWNSDDNFLTQSPYAPSPWTGGFVAGSGGTVFQAVDGRYYDQFGHLLIGYVPVVEDPDLWQPSQPLISPSSPAPIQVTNTPTTLPGQTSPPVAPIAGTQQAIGVVEPHQGVQYAISQVSLSDLYGAPSDNGTLRVTASIFPDEAPADSKPIVMYSVFNNTDQPIEGLTYSVYAVDASGQQYQVVGNASLPTLPPYGPNGGTLCISWLGFVNGSVNLYVTINSATGQIIVVALAPGTILPPGTLPPPPQATPNELPASITQYAGFNAAITSKFQGSRNAVGDDDFYLFTALSDRVSIVVTITADAAATGFLPVLKIYNTSDLDTPIVTHDQRFPVAEPDRSKHAIGWKDRQSLPFLTVGQTYLLQVVHKYPFWSRRWGFKVYLKETVADTTANLSVDGGLLAGSVTSAYGRQSLKILNDRTGGVLFVGTDPYGICDDVGIRAHPFGDTLAVATGDLLRIYRPGIGVRYRHDDLLTSVTA